MIDRLLTYYCHSWREQRAAIQNRASQTQYSNLAFMERLLLKFFDFLRQSHEASIISLILLRGVILRITRFFKKINIQEIATEFNNYRALVLRHFIDEGALPSSPLRKFFDVINKAQLWSIGAVEHIATPDHITALGELINVLSAETISYDSDAQRIAIASKFIHPIILERFYNLPLQKIEQLLLAGFREEFQDKRRLQDYLLYCLSSRTASELETRCDLQDWTHAMHTFAVHHSIGGRNSFEHFGGKKEHQNQVLLLSFFDTYSPEAAIQASADQLLALTETLKDGTFIGSVKDWAEYDKAQREISSQAPKKEIDENALNQICACLRDIVCPDSLRSEISIEQFKLEYLEPTLVETMGQLPADMLMEWLFQTNQQWAGSHINKQTYLIYCLSSQNSLEFKERRDVAKYKTIINAIALALLHADEFISTLENDSPIHRDPLLLTQNGSNSADENRLQRLRNQKFFVECFKHYLEGEHLADEKALGNLSKKMKDGIIYGSLDFWKNHSTIIETPIESSSSASASLNDDVLGRAQQRL